MAEGREHLVFLRIRVSIITIIKNFNRRSSHGHHGSKRRELAQNAHSRGSYALLDINTVRTALCEAPGQLLHNLESI